MLNKLTKPYSQESETHEIYIYSHTLSHLILKAILKRSNMITPYRLLPL
jgi:hypothetical protein